MQQRLTRSLFYGIALIFAFNVHAEPWLASRYATNCAACHAPGRVNLPAKERRCTLSCQGCHTNPNGGGLRNFYGKWNQERFLRTYYNPNYRMNKPKPDVTSEQQYTKEKLAAFAGANADPKLLKRAVGDGFRLKETNRRLPDSAYDRTTADEEIIEPNMDMAILRMPEKDPWRLRRTNYFNAGLDMRYSYLARENPTKTPAKTKATFPMNTDLSVSAEPYHRVTLVWESRFSTPPTREGWDEGYTTNSQVRSAYVMVDDLPYNSFFMYGLYRPMMGHNNPDHTSLFAYGTGLNMNSYFKAATVGLAPNVPFLNFHYIQPLGDTSSLTKSQDQGFALNVGARWVTLGLYVTASYWKTTADYRAAGGNIIDNTYSSLTGGGTLGRWTLVMDFTNIEKDQKNIRTDKGTVLTVENRVRLMGENYILANYEMLSTDLTLQKGSATQMTVGVSSFPYSSVELSLLIKKMKLETGTPAVAHDVSTTLGQLHLFF